MLLKKDETETRIVVRRNGEDERERRENELNDDNGEFATANLTR